MPQAGSGSQRHVCRTILLHQWCESPHREIGPDKRALLIVSNNAPTSLILGNVAVVVPKPLTHSRISQSGARGHHRLQAVLGRLLRLVFASASGTALQKKFAQRPDR
jgi:hypothetical protein